MKTDSVSNLTYEYSVNKIMHPCQYVFNFYSDSNMEKAGILVCHKSELQIRPNYDGNVLAIDFIEVTNKNQGFGTKILKFAEEYSKRIGCNGFMTLKADSSRMPERIPHIFYRKFGFSTLENNTDEKLDKFIKQKSNATKNDFPCLLMHYPVLRKKQSNLKKFFSFFQRLLKL